MWAALETAQYIFHICMKQITRLFYKQRLQNMEKNPLKRNKLSSPDLNPDPDHPRWPSHGYTPSCKKIKSIGAIFFEFRQTNRPKCITSRSEGITIALLTSAVCCRSAALPCRRTIGCPSAMLCAIWLIASASDDAGVAVPDSTQRTKHAARTYSLESLDQTRMAGANQVSRNTFSWTPTHAS